MFKKITGLVLGIALFTMCPLTAAAAPMVPAPYTADQLVDLSRAALAGVSSYHVDSVESTEFTYPATPQANFSYVETSQLTATPSCIYYQVVESVTTGGSTEAKTVERYTSFEGNTLKEYTHNNNLPWGFRSRPVTQKGVTSFSMPDSFSLLKKNSGQAAIPVYTDGVVYQFTEQASKGSSSLVYTFDAASLLLISIHAEFPGTPANNINRMEYVITYNMYDNLAVPAEIVSAAIPVS